MRLVRSFLLATAARRHPLAFLCSYPKCGRTWLRYTLASYLLEREQPGASLDFGRMFRLLPNDALSLQRGLPAFERSRQAGFPLILASHRRHDARRFSGGRLLFMVRSVPDVLVSDYFHVGRQERRWAADLPTFIRDPRRGLPRLIRYLDSWSAALPMYEHLVISYEDMHADPLAALRGVTALLGIPFEEAPGRAAIEAGSFSRMRATELTAGLPGIRYDRTDRQALRVREGRIGGSSAHLEPADLDFIATTLAATASLATRELIERVPPVRPQELRPTG